MTGTIREENLSLALRFIVDNFGKNTLLNPKKVESVLLDLLPKSTNEISWIIDAINTGIMKALVEESNVDEKSRQEVINRVQEMFKEHYVAQLRMDYILDNILYALSWNNEKVDNLSEYKAKRDGNTLQKDTIEEDENDNLNLNVIDTSKNNLNKKELNYEEILKSQLIKNSREISKKEGIIQNQNYPNVNKSKKKFLWLLLIPIFIVLGLVANKLLSGPGDIRVSDFKFDSEYELNDSVYVFDTNDTVELNITLDADKYNNIDYDKVSYSVDDFTICNYKKLTYNKCTLEGVGEGNTKLRIYYDGQEIDSLYIGFKDIDS